MIEKLQFMTIMLVNDMKAKRDEEGATAVEYGLMVALIAIAIIGAVTLLGNNLSTLFSSTAALICTIAPQTSTSCTVHCRAAGPAARGGAGGSQ